VSREVDEALAAWRSAAREREASPPTRDAACRLARAWLRYQLAVGAVDENEIVLVADDDGVYVAATPSVERYLGFDVETLLGLSIEDVTPRRDRRQAAGAWATFLAQGSARGDFQLRRRDGKELAVSFSARTNVPARGLHVSRLTPVAIARSHAELASATASVIATTRDRIDETRGLLRALRGERPPTLRAPRPPVALGPIVRSAPGRLDEAG
jgi:PAS domain S-box-containing protein